MTQRRWTLLVVPEGTTESPRSYAISRRALHGLTTTAGVLSLVAVMGLGAAITTYATPSGRAARADAEQLGGELTELRQKLAVLQDTIRAIGVRDERVRTLAGLAPVDSAVREAGIGGPGTPSLDSDAVYKTDPTLGRLAFGARSDLDG